MPNTIQKIIFPDNYRQVPQRRLILNVLRAAHLLTISILVGGFYFQIEQSVLHPWLIAAIVSGLSMFMLDVYESGDALFEVRGASVLLKIALLLCIPLVNNEKQTLLLLSIIIFSAFISHSTKRIRHKTFLPVSLLQQIGMHSRNHNPYRKK